MSYTIKVVLRGTERSHMEKYLKDRGYRQESPDLFRGDGIEALFAPARKVMLGSLQITEVEVVFKGEEGYTASEVSLFRRRFLTAGG